VSDTGEPRPDAGEPRADAGEPRADAGEPRADAGEPRADAGGAGEPDGGEWAVGWCAREVELELPGLRLLAGDAVHARAQPLTGRSPPEIASRLRELSNRFRGARAVRIRQEAVPAAQRVFFRQIGLDPDAVRTPIEAALIERMLHGGFLSAGLLEDVLLIALLDTGVPVWALEAGSIDGRLGIRASVEGEPLGRSDGARLPAGRLVVADARAAVALLFGPLADGCRPSASTTRLTLFALQVPGVPSLYVEEALWACRAALGACARW
jgi:DNA/RNA-binding domain of Phe-tRNA-synthetase-like protein